jgi:PPOX class probable F420-dependent enzyme
MTSPTPATEALAPFVEQKTILLTTYKRDGTPVGTPISIAVEGDHAFIRTYDRAWKAKRMRNNPKVEIAPSTTSGKPTGPAIRARVRLLEGDEAKHAARLLADKNRVLQRIVVPAYHRLRGYRTLHYELRPE